MVFPKGGREVIHLKRGFTLWLAVGIVTGALATAGCQEKEEPVPAASPAAPAAVAPEPAGGDIGPSSSAATGEAKSAEKQEASTKKY